jgi:hypothetical protein
MNNNENKMTGKQKLIMVIAIIIGVVALGYVGEGDREMEQLNAAPTTEATIQPTPVKDTSEAAYHQAILDTGYELCNNSRINMAGYSEEACGTYLDAHSLDFICQELNSNMDNDCHIEQV